eukprot:COSAG03_NODE_3962_length_1740_cov_1.357709_2_plen_164_part_00
MLACRAVTGHGVFVDCGNHGTAAQCRLRRLGMPWFLQVALAEISTHGLHLHNTVRTMSWLQMIQNRTLTRSPTGALGTSLYQTTEIFRRVACQLPLRECLRPILKGYLLGFMRLQWAVLLPTTVRWMAVQHWRWRRRPSTDLRMVTRECSISLTQTISSHLGE